MSHEPLTADEELFWRSLQRLVMALPRALEEDLLQETGLTLTEYAVLVNLSEARSGELRMTDLASATALSASRITRVVESLQRRDLVVKNRTAGDGRGFAAGITEAGRDRLKSAYPIHLASARARVVDRFPADLLGRLAPVFADIAGDLAPEPRRSKTAEDG